MVIKGRNVLLFLGLLILFISCSTPNQISKVQKNGKIIVNDCISFREKLAGVVEANKSENLVVSNSPDFNNPFPYSLEGGQFEQLQDTVFFRLRREPITDSPPADRMNRLSLIWQFSGKRTN